MKEIIEQWVEDTLKSLQATDKLPGDLALNVRILPNRDPAFGEYTTNIAMVLAKQAGMDARELADLIQMALDANKVPVVAKVATAGPGFINFYLQQGARLSIIADVLAAGVDYGKVNIGKGEKVLVEFLSANPTGPLHVGHGRIAAFGDAVANVLKAAGFDVTTEYYVNDAGRQMDILATSVWMRYLELAGEPIIFPVNAYRGAYVYAIAEELMNFHNREFVHPWAEVVSGLPKDETEGGDKELYIDALTAKTRALLGKDGFAIFHRHATEFVLQDIQQDMEEFRVHYDNWFSEQSLFDDGSLEQSINDLKQTGHTFEREGALWFKATAFGDEKDRVLIRANGHPTYFASDVAYHWNKYHRGFTKLVDCVGSDHHGYFGRLIASMKALGHKGEDITVLFVQFAILYRGGEKVQMSTRSGSFVTLRELRDEVGTDAARFFYAMRKSDQHMDFDLDLAKSRSNENPVYYVQYAHARICSVMRQLNERGLVADQAIGLASLDLLQDKHENDLAGILAKFPEMIKLAANDYEPHQVAYYLRELATALHSYYNAVTILCEDEALRAARLCLLRAVRVVLKNGLLLLGVSAPESM